MEIQSFAFEELSATANILILWISTAKGLVNVLTQKTESFKDNVLLCSKSSVWEKASHLIRLFFFSTLLSATRPKEKLVQPWPLCTWNKEAHHILEIESAGMWKWRRGAPLTLELLKYWQTSLFRGHLLSSPTWQCGGKWLCDVSF